MGMSSLSVPRAKRKGYYKKLFIKIATYLILIIGSVAVFLPFFWMFVTSIKQPGEIYTLPIKWWPSSPSLRSYVDLFGKYKFDNYFFNTGWLTAVNIIGYLLTSAMVAYAFATQRWWHKEKLFLFVLATMMLPKEVTFYPQFILFRFIGWYGSMKPLWVPSFFADAFQIFLIRQFFMGISTELQDAAKIDGCSRYRTFASIYLPLSKPILATSAMYIFMYHWNDFFKPLIYITKESNRTAALALMYLRSTQDTVSLMPAQMAASVVLSLPCILLYYIMQRYFIAGVVYKGGR